MRHLTAEQIVVHTAWFNASKAHSDACFANPIDVKDKYIKIRGTEEALRLANNACVVAKIDGFEHQDPFQEISVEIDPKIAEVIATFPATFGLREYPIETFRISARDSGFLDGEIVLDIEHCVMSEWRPMLLRSPAQVRESMFTLP